MKRFTQGAAIITTAAILGLSACNDNNSPIGAGLVDGTVSITVDSLTLSLDAETTVAPKYDARSTTNIIGRITAPEYGELNCEYIARLMCASQLPLPDSITTEHLDSVSILLRVPRNQITGDSLAPQQLRVYLMNSKFNDVKADTVTNEFNPDGFYDASNPLVSKSYTLSGIAGSDVMLTSSLLTLPIKLTGDNYDKFGPDLVKQYRTNPDMFEWPKSFQAFLPGIYVKPVFGSGCIANVEATQFMLYYHTRYTSVEYKDNEVVEVEKVKKDSVSLIATAPEVLSTNRIVYKPAPVLAAMQAQGKCIVTTPGGYQTRMTFPAERILDEYNRHDGSASMISNLNFAIPASKIRNDYGIGVPPYLLMVKASAADQFFNEGKLPDGTGSFWGSYNSNNGEYVFTSLRDYIIELSKKDKITAEDTEFLIIPVNLGLETNTNNYTGETTTTVTSCTPYLTAPTMCELHTDRAKIVFTYSAQYNK